MRIMRTKILTMGELQEGGRGIQYICKAIFYRVEDLARVLILLPTVPATLT
jgi:hypothetical protein